MPQIPLFVFFLGSRFSGGPECREGFYALPASPVTIVRVLYILLCFYYPFDIFHGIWHVHLGVTQDGRKTHPYVLSHRKSKTEKWWQHEKLVHLFPVPLPF